MACPDETKGDGTIIFDRPTAYMGKWVSGVRFDFKDGTLTITRLGLTLLCSNPVTRRLRAKKTKLRWLA